MFDSDDAFNVPMIHIIYESGDFCLSFGREWVTHRQTKMIIFSRAHNGRLHCSRRPDFQKSVKSVLYLHMLLVPRHCLQEHWLIWEKKDAQFSSGWWHFALTKSTLRIIIAQAHLHPVFWLYKIFFLRYTWYNSLYGINLFGLLAVDLII